MSDARTRFAPSPTGHLHLGHAASAFAVWRAAEDIGAPVLLRIEDIDQTRCRPEYETSIQQDLEWLGLKWTGPVRRQSEHFADYAAIIEALRARGLVYRCFKTRREIADATGQSDSAQDAAYTGQSLPEKEESERLDRGDPFAWRLSLAAASDALGAQYDRLHYLEKNQNKTMEIPALPAIFGDVVLARKDTPASYHLACCHDDALQSVTHIVRGEDLRDVTQIHVLLQALMDWPAPLYQFHPVILGADGKKLSKRASDKGLRAYRDEGMTPADIRSMTIPA